MQIYIKVFLLIFSFFPITYAGAGVTLSLLSLDQATKKVIAEVESKVLGAKTESIDGKTVHVIKVLTPDGHVQQLKVDAESGEIIK